MVQYNFRVLKIGEYAEWQPSPDNPNGPAGPNVDGAWLARRVTVEISNGLSVLETRDFLVPEPYSTEALQQVLQDYRQTLPDRHSDEGLEIVL